MLKIEFLGAFANADGDAEALSGGGYAERPRTNCGLRRWRGWVGAGEAAEGVVGVGFVEMGLWGGGGGGQDVARVDAVGVGVVGVGIDGGAISKFSRHAALVLQRRLGTGQK